MVYTLFCQELQGMQLFVSNTVCNNNSYLPLQKIRYFNTINNSNSKQQ